MARRYDHRFVDPEALELPYFVYGTLRPGYGNHVLWEQFAAVATHDGEATVSGYHMHGNTIPYAVATTQDARIVGAIITPPGDPVLQFHMRASLDALEGHPHAYTRIRTVASTPDGDIECWIYSCARSWAGQTPREPTGDYANMVLRGRQRRELFDVH